MAYNKNEWIDHIVDGDIKYTATQNPDGTLTLTPVLPVVVQEGTRFTAARMNNIEEGVEAAHNDKVNKAGDIMTGGLTIEQDGIYPWFDWSTNEIDGNSPASDYPVGISMSHYPGSTGMPESQCTILTVKRSEFYMFQLAFNRTTPQKMWVRSHYNQWTPWEEISGDSRTLSIRPYLNGIDLDTVLGVGLYHLSTNCVNMPLSGWNGWLSVTPNTVGSTTTVIQEATMWVGSPYQVRKFQRVMLQGVWKPWEEISLITEKGSNANGEYIRFADGTQICYHRFSISATANTSIYQDWTFPASFADVINTKGQATLTSVGSNGIFQFTAPCRLDPIWAQPTTQGKRLIFTANVTQAYTFDLMAIGRWK